MSCRDSADHPHATQDVDLLVADLGRVLRTEMLRESCSASAIARLFSIHRRTLSRHLRSLGLTYRQVANEVRFEIACELLETTDLTLSQIAAALKYSELSAFTRAFRRWCRQTPSEWRANHPRRSRSKRSWKLGRPDLVPDPNPAREPDTRAIVTVTE